MAGRRLLQDASSLWIPLEATVAAAVCRRGGQQTGSDLHLFAVMYGRGGDTTKAVKDKMSAVVKKLRSILALHPRDLLRRSVRGHGLLHPCTR
jgi:hypothetical protein